MCAGEQGLPGAASFSKADRELGPQQSRNDLFHKGKATSYFPDGRAVGIVGLPALFPIAPGGRFVSAGLFLENAPEEGRLTLGIKAMMLPTAESQVLGS